MQRAFDHHPQPSPVASRKLHEASLEYQLQHLSPLDAFKARGKYLHEQLRREGNLEEAAPSQPRESYRSSFESDDAFSLDYKLQSRKSSLAWPVEEQTPSIRSQRVDIDGLSRMSSTGTSRTSTSSSLYASETETIRAPSSPEAHSRSQQIRPGCFDPISTYSAITPSVPPSQSADSRQVHSRSSTSRSRTPSELINSPDRNSLISSPSSSLYSVSSSYMHDKGSSSHQVETNPSSKGYPGSEASSSRSRLDRTDEDTNHSKLSMTPLYKSSPRLNSSDGRSPRQLTSTSNSPVSSPSTPNRTTLQPGRSLTYSASPQVQTVNGAPRRPSLGGPNKSSLGRSNTRNPSIRDTRVASLPDAELSAATHIELGIEQHEANQLPQSTHHFKVAADMGDPTGCLLYGLSLRHGWGIRPDMQRSIQMLQKAADTVTSLNVETLRSSKMMERQLNEDLAIAIYELGVSYKNGWGVVADKKLSLKYFELATSWGDVEAIMEAAECYLHGTGCKKDKAKAARYLRMAEGKGKKEIGNSWIWKSKYDET